MKKHMLWLTLCVFLAVINLSCRNTPTPATSTVKSEAEPVEPVAPKAPITYTALSGNGTSLVTVGKKFVWMSTRPRKIRQEFALASGESLRCLSLSDDGNYVLALRSGGALRVPHLELWEYSGGKMKRLWSLDKKFAYEINAANKSEVFDKVGAALILPNKILVSALGIVTLDYKGNEIRKIPGGGSSWSPLGTAFSPDGRYLWSGNDMYDARNGKTLWHLWEEQFVDHVRFSPSGNWISINAIGPTNDEINNLFATKPVQDFSDSEFFTVGFFAPDDSIAVWDVPLYFVNPRTKKRSSFRKIKPFADTRKDIVKDVQISRDGKTVAALSHSGKIWLQCLP